MQYLPPWFAGVGELLRVAKQDVTTVAPQEASQQIRWTSPRFSYSLSSIPWPQKYITGFPLWIPSAGVAPLEPALQVSYLQAKLKSFWWRAFI
jgi:hypothetical protein